MAEKKAAAPPSGQKRLRVHLLIESADGPIPSGPSQGAIPLGTHSRWRVACDQNIRMGDFDRGTHEAHAVCCDACKATAAYKAMDPRKPGSLDPEQMIATGSDCCG